MKAVDEKEIERLLNFLASCPRGNTTVTRAQLRAMLLKTDGKMFACGELFDIQSKNLGAGVYRVTLSPFKG